MLLETAELLDYSRVHQRATKQCRLDVVHNQSAIGVNSPKVPQAGTGIIEL